MGQDGDYALGRKSGAERQRPEVLVYGSWVWKSTVGRWSPESEEGGDQMEKDGYQA